MELSQNLWQTFACVASEKKSSKNGVVTKFMANVCLCSIRKKNPQKMELSQNVWQTFASVASKKNFPQKMELSQNLWQTFTSVASKKNFPQKNGVVTKFMANFCLCSIR